MERKRNTSGFDPGDRGSIPLRVTELTPSVWTKGKVGGHCGAVVCRFESCCG